MSHLPLWTCPHCGHSFVNVNQPHSCGKHTVAEFLEDKNAAAVALFHRFVALVETCGPVIVAPAALLCPSLSHRVGE
jgi:hypothetical protein